MRVLLGGSFDPVHEGHLCSAAELHQLLGATVWLVPAARSPLKADSTADRHRFAMLLLAVATRDGLAIDDRELRRPPPSYTIDTLRELRSTLGAEEPLVWIIGADSLATLDQWKDWQALPGLTHLLVMDRPGCPWPDTGAVASWLQQLPRADALNQLQCRPQGLLARVSLTPQAVSSTRLRALLTARGPHSPKPDGLPDAVWRYILDHQLYMPDKPAQTPEAE